MHDGTDEADVKQEKKGWRYKNEYVMFLFLLMCEEWGDKSQFAAIALAANYGVIPIIIGGCLVSCSCLFNESPLGTRLLYINCYDAWSHCRKTH